MPPVDTELSRQKLWSRWYVDEFDIPESHDRLITAVLIAARAHDEQVDKGGDPVYWHVLRVGISLLPDFDAAILGILHDVLEDCDLKHGTFALDFLGDPRLRETLCTLTRSKDEPYRDYIARVAKDPLARKVKLADLEDNMNPLRLGRAVQAGADVGPLMLRYLNAIAYLRSCEGTI